jgi:hypothetical protein
MPTQLLAADARTWGVPLLTLASEANAGLIALGARIISQGRVGAWWSPTYE